MRESIKIGKVSFVNLTHHDVSVVDGLALKQASARTSGFGSPRVSKNTWYLVDESRLFERDDFVWFDSLVTIGGAESVMARYKNQSVTYLRGADK